MRQEFFTSDLVSKYIKYLLSYTPLPLYPTIEHNQYMIEGCTYIHKDKVLRCTESGIFSAMLNYVNEPDYLMSSNKVTVQHEDIIDYMTIIDNVTGNVIRDENGNIQTSPLVVTDKLVYINNIKFAKYELVNDYTFGEKVAGVTQEYISNTSFYDSFTHKILGDYLRLIRNQYGLDLMSLYNCYNHESLTTVSLYKTAPFVKFSSISNKKLLLVPIKFNTQYTVAIECNTPILVKGVVYKNNTLVLNNDKSDFISNVLSDTTQQINSCKFNKPFLFSIENKQKYLQQFEGCLYMALQVPYNLQSSVVVLEGDFIDKSQREISDIKVINSVNPTKITSSLCSQPSLLEVNDGRQHPFSDKLISYLLRNTIDEREYIDDNVANVEKKINYIPKYQGMWDNQLRYILYNKYMDIAEKHDLNTNDILGFVDLDIEEAVRKGYIKYES